MPAIDHGKRWATYELKEHAIETGSLNLAPFADHNIFLLRAHDGMGICSLLAATETETTSVAFAFETGEVWSIDTTLFQYHPSTLPFLEPYFERRLQDYARFLGKLGLSLPYKWIGGLTGVRDRQLAMPSRGGYVAIPGWPGPKFLSESVIEEGDYDGKQKPGDALLPLFKAIFDKCGIPRPDYLNQ
jgi:hypothetical protein